MLEAYLQQLMSTQRGKRIVTTPTPNLQMRKLRLRAGK